MARWETALDYQVELWQFAKSEHGKEYHRGFAQSVLNNSHPDLPVASEDIYHQLPRLVEAAIFNADPIYIDPDMMTVAEAAFGTIKPELLQATDLITPSGFMLLPRPIRFPDIRNKFVANRAILWTPARYKSAENDTEAAGILLFLFSHIDDDDDYWHKVNPNIHLIESRELDHIYTSQMRRYFLGTNNLILNHVEPWPFNRRPGIDDPRSLDPYVQTLWRLLAQTITTKTKSRASTPFRKRAAKATFPEKQITVVTLRRPRHAPNEDYEPKNVDWTHRWLVSGHWRNQYFPSIDMHRQIWVGSYVKGPDDKPLKIRKVRIFELVQ
jgi:hypothetical protein